MFIFNPHHLVPASFIIAALGLASAPAAAQPANILFFGNSFTQGGDVSGDVGRLAVADGYDAPNIVADLTGGKNLDFHLNEVNTRPANNVDHSAISGDTWDYVVIQGFSTESTSTLGNHAEFASDARALYSGVRNHGSGHGAGVTGILFQTWARGPGHAIYPGTFSDPAAMQAEVRGGYQAALAAIQNAHGGSAAHIAPVGDAFESENFNPSLYAGDIYHASNRGSLLASMMLYRTIYGESVSDIAYSSVSGWAGVNASTWSDLTAIADATLIPEPGSLSLLIVAAGLTFLRRR